MEVYPTYENIGYRIELWGDEVEKLSIFDPLTGDVTRDLEKLTVYPKSHFVIPRPRLDAAVQSIRAELKDWEALLERQNKLLEVATGSQRTLFDMEMIKELATATVSRTIRDISPGVSPDNRRRPSWTICPRMP